MDTLLAAQERESLGALLEGASRVVATCHVNPDGDAIGALTALVALMRRMGKEAIGVTPNPFPDYLRFMEGTDGIFVGTEHPEVKQAMKEADLVVCLDFNDFQRCGAPMAALMESSPARRLMIDHHLSPEPFCDVAVSRPELSSTCETLLWLEQELGLAEGMTTGEATSLYTGIMTDTGAFAYASSRPELFESVAWLLRRGVDKDRAYREVFQSSTEGKLRLEGYMLYVKMEVMKEQGAALMSLSHEEYRRFALRRGDTEGLVNLPLDIEGIDLSVFLRQDIEDRRKVRVSLRSLGDFPCDVMARECFGGGGHRNASGGLLVCPMEVAEQRAREAIKRFRPIKTTA